MIAYLVQSLDSIVMVLKSSFDLVLGILLILKAPGFRVILNIYSLQIRLVQLSKIHLYNAFMPVINKFMLVNTMKYQTIIAVIIRPIK